VRKVTVVQQERQDLRVSVEDREPLVNQEIAELLALVVGLALLGVLDRLVSLDLLDSLDREDLEAQLDLLVL